ncbi:MAG: hypothetical protein Q8J64_06415 [Thermodesulfovibrionales bacterium]|nr:hypothetical protein [Thermodesulfovibrionales bacterium]
MSVATLERRVETLEKEVAELQAVSAQAERQAYIKELARQISSGNRQALKEHNRRAREERRKES